MWEAVKTEYTFLVGFLLGGSNVKKCGDHQKMKFFINNSVEAVIPFKEKHQGVLKLHVPLVKGEGSSNVAKPSVECPQTNFNSQISTSY